jgi:acyl-CoA thioesterase-1
LKRLPVTLPIVACLVLTGVQALAGPEGQPAPPAASPAVAPVQADAPFPGQHSWPLAEWKYPVWPSSCAGFAGDERIACLEFVVFDFGRLSRYAATNALLAQRRAGESRVVFFGDSITDGWSAPQNGGFFPGQPYVNRGIGGQTTAQMLLRFRQDVIALDPVAVVILAGTNDLSGNSGPMSLSASEDNLAAMSELAKTHGIKVVLASLLPVSDEKKDQEGRPRLQSPYRPPEKIRALNAWLADYARQNGHVYLDYFSAVVDGAGRLRSDVTDDGLHPNASGYALMAPLAEKAIRDVLAAPH